MISKKYFIIVFAKKVKLTQQGNSKQHSKETTKHAQYYNTLETTQIILLETSHPYTKCLLGAALCLIPRATTSFTPLTYFVALILDTT